MTRRLFVLGAQRSGTTYTASALAGHRDCGLLVNGKLLYYLNVWVLRDPTGTVGGHLRLDEIVHSLRRRPILGVSEQTAARIVRRIEVARPVSTTPLQVVRELWDDALAELGGRAVIGEKYNEYLLQLRELRAVFPDAYYLFIHRSPADVAESMLRAFAERPWCPRDAEGAVAKWTEWNDEWLRARAEVPAERRLEVSYAALTSDPAAIFARICELVDIEPYAEFLAAVTGATRRGLGGKGAAAAIDWRAVRERAPRFDAVCEALGHRRPDCT